MNRWTCQWVGSFLVLVCAASSVRGQFPLKDGDVWVMAGDSITAQHLHSNYFEAFCFARYPQVKFAFRNSGVGGHTIPTTLARFDYDVAAWRPTVVSVELGMNDHGGTPTDKFVANMKTMVDRIRGVGARPVILAASPINDGRTLEQLEKQKHRLQEYAKALKPFCEAEKIPYADQYHELVDLWAANKPRERVAEALQSIRALTRDDKTEGVEHLRAFLAVQDKSASKPVSMMGDPVHPGATGQLMMAAALLKELGVDGFVSAATVNAPDGAVAEAAGCRIENVKAEAGRIEFDRLDERLPFPIPDEARVVLPLYPSILELSRYTLKVTGLAEGNYALKINGVDTAVVSAKELAAGVNLTAYGAEPGKAVNPIVGQSRGILNAVAAKEQIVGQWRGLSKRAHEPGAAAELKEQLAALTKKVEEADEKIREAAKPRKMRIEVAPVK